jgi:predicted RNase H-like HicB family nuclease
MNTDFVPSIGLSSLPVLVRQDSSGHCTAQVVGLPEIQATAATREEALGQVRDAAAAWLASGELVALPIPPQPSLSKPTGWADDDVLEMEFLDELARLRRNDLERTLREDAEEDAGCSSTSSTPTT